MIMFIVKGYKNYSRKTQSFNVIFEGIDLKPKAHFASGLYYVHYLGIWLCIASLIFLTPVFNSNLLWIFMTCIQGSALIINLIPIFKSKFLWLQTVLWEAYILFVCLYLTILHFKGKQSEEQMLR